MTSAPSLCLGIFPRNVALNLVDDSGVAVGSRFVWGWLFGKDLVGQGREALLEICIVPMGRQSGREL